MHAPHAMYASVVCERHRALRVAAEAQVLTWVCLADDHASLLHLRRVAEAEALISGAEGRERCVEVLDRRALACAGWCRLAASSAPIT